MAPAAKGAAGASARTSHSFDGTPAVGALFMPHGYPTIHTCTASVVRSKSRDVIMTAAHCVIGNGKGYVFAPGYNGKTPYGVWKVTAAYGSPKWIHQQDTQRDWAFLRVANRTTAAGKVQRLQDVVGGNRLGRVAKPTAIVQVPGYPISANKPITCNAPVYIHRGFPAFDCRGYSGGVSGAPFLLGKGRVRTIVGVIGGLHQGGCSPSTSYAARLGAPARSAFKRAEHDRTASVFPAPPGDGC